MVGAEVVGREMIGRKVVGIDVWLEERCESMRFRVGREVRRKVPVVRKEICQQPRCGSQTGLGGEEVWLAH